MAVTTSSGVGSWNFMLRQNSDFDPTMTWTDDNGQPMNLTGWLMTMNIARGVNMTPLLTLNSSSTTGSRIVLGGTAGTVTIIIEAADTAVLTAYGSVSPSINQYPAYRLGVHELVYTAADGSNGCLLEGIVSLEPQVPV